MQGNAYVLQWYDDIPLSDPSYKGKTDGCFISGFEGWRERQHLPNVIVFPEDLYGVGTLRLFIPGREVHKAGLANVFLTNTWSDAVFDFADLCVFQRVQRKIHLEALTYIRDVLKKPMVMDADDNFLRISRSVRKMREAEYGGDISEIFRHAAMKSTALTVSTQPLQSAYKQYNRDISVCRNRVDYSRKPPTRRQNSRHIVGMAGSGAGDHEWVEASAGITELMRRRNDFDFVMGGRDYRHVFPADVRDRIIVLSPYPYHMFNAMSYGFDIGIAPIKQSPFCESKSNIKALDYAMHGIPVVCGNAGPYVSHAADGAAAIGRQVVVLASTAQDWEREIEKLLDNRDWREELGAANSEYCRKFFDVDGCVGDYWPTWERALSWGREKRCRL